MDDYDAMSRYSSQYEAQLDPFTAFGAKVHSCSFPVYTQLHSGSYPTGRTTVYSKLAHKFVHGFQREFFWLLALNYKEEGYCTSECLIGCVLTNQRGLI